MVKKTELKKVSRKIQLDHANRILNQRLVIKANGETILNTSLHTLHLMNKFNGPHKSLRLSEGITLEVELVAE